MLELQSIINLAGKRKEYIKSRERIAKDILRRMYGRTFFYNIPELSDDFGFCTIQSITYDKLFDKFIYVIRDCNTKSEFITERCNLYLIEIE